MEVLSLIWGILAVLGLGVAFFPCLGSLNWLNIPFSVIGLAIGLVATNKAQPDKKNLATAGVVLCAVAVVLGALRLFLGGGIF
jgi:cobalamin biosynthesis protein CobD/CbiB